MPANPRKGKQAVKNDAYEFTDKEGPAEGTMVEETSNRPPKRSRVAQSAFHTMSDEESDSEENVREAPSTDVEMQNLLSSFGADITKTLAAKRKRLQTFTQASLKTSNKKYDDVFKQQLDERNKLTEEFTKQIGNVFTQWENDLAKAKDVEDKLDNLLRQQQKALSQQRVVQNQRIKALKQLHDQYMKSQTDLDKVHQDQQSNIQGELRKELAMIQKKILMESQQEEITNVRKSLQSMLAQV